MGHQLRTWLRSAALAPVFFAHAPKTAAKRCRAENRTPADFASHSQLPGASTATASQVLLHLHGDVVESNVGLVFCSVYLLTTLTKKEEQKTEQKGSTYFIEVVLNMILLL